MSIFRRFWGVSNSKWSFTAGKQAYRFFSYMLSGGPFLPILPLKLVARVNYGKKSPLAYVCTSCLNTCRFYYAGLLIFTALSILYVVRMKQNNFLQQVYIALTNALNSPEILALLQEFGYDDKKVRDGLKRYDKVVQLNQQQQLVTLEARTASRALQESRQQLTTIFQSHLDIARLAYKREAGYTDTLSLTQARGKTTPDLLAQTKRFYANIPVALMEKYHVPQKELTEANKLSQQVMDLVALQRRTQGQMQEFTQVRKAAVAELKDWMNTFFTIAKIALREHPQQLEALDIVVPS